MKYEDARMDGFKLRFAEEKDIGILLEMIKELAVYEKLLDEVTATEETLKESLFIRKVAEAVIAEYEDKPIGYIIFFHNFSTFTGRPGLYLEDLYVRPEMRGRGFGKTMLSFLAKLAVERKCARVEWACLDWNTHSIGFYKRMGAVPMDEWTVYRLAGSKLNELADEFRPQGSPE